MGGCRFELRHAIMMAADAKIDSFSPIFLVFSLASFPFIAKNIALYTLFLISPAVR